MSAGIVVRRAVAADAATGFSKIMVTSAAHCIGAHRVFGRLGIDGHAKRGLVKYRRQFAAP